MVSTNPLISKSNSPCTNFLVTVRIAQITTGINVTFMLYSFFNSLGMSRYLSLFSLSFNFTPWSSGTAKSTIRQILIFLFWLLQDLVVCPRLSDPLISHNLSGVYAPQCLGQIQGSTLNICSHGKIWIFCIVCIVSDGTHAPLSRTYSYTLSVIIFCFCLLCD